MGGGRGGWGQARSKGRGTARTPRRAAPGVGPGGSPAAAARVSRAGPAPRRPGSPDCGAARAEAEGNRLPPSPVPSPRPRRRVRSERSPSSPPPGAPSSLPDPRGRPEASPGGRVKGAFSKVKARPAGTWGFSLAEHELCNRIVTDHGSGRESEGPHRSAKGGFIFQRGTHSHRPGISGRRNVAKRKKKKKE